MQEQLWCFQVATDLELTREIVVLTPTLAQAWNEARAQLEPGERIVGDRLATFTEPRSHK